MAAGIILGIALRAQSPMQATPAKERLEGLQKRAALEAQSLVKNIPFRNIGPVIMSGRVVDIDVNPADPTEFYVAYATGGLWYTHNNGQSFVPLFDQEDAITIGDIAVNWQHHIIWVGTGEVNASRSSYAGIGVYKSTDEGKHWQYLGLPESHHIGKILLHPKDPNIAWVAAAGHLYSPNKERGVYKTTDGGKNWTQTLYIDENTGAVEMDIDSKDPNTLYAAMWHKTRRAWNFEESGNTSGIYKSTDGGEHWNLLTKEGSGFLTGEGVGRIGLSVFPQDPNVVYAIVDNNNEKKEEKKDTSQLQEQQFKTMSRETFARLDDKKLENFLRDNRFPAKYTAKGVKEMVASGKIQPIALYDFLHDDNNALTSKPVIGAEVYRSEDGGKSWRKMNKDFISLYYSYGYYFGKIWVSPTNKNKIFISGVPLLMSEDGGATYEDIDKENVHGDHHALWINPQRDSHLVNGSDGGIHISYDNGAHWFKANTPPVGQFYSVNVDEAKPYNVYGGLQDNGVWYGPSTHVENYDWYSEGQYAYKRLYGGDGMQVAVDTRDNNLVYTGLQFGNYARVNKATGAMKPIHPSSELGELPLRFNWQTPILLSRHNQDVFYMGSNRFHRSLNKAENMETLSGDLTNGGKKGDVPYGTLSTIAESPLKFGLLYVGTDDGNIQLSKDGGYTWTKISEQLPQNLWVSRVTPSAFKEGRVYASLNGYRYDNFLPYLYVSEDYGTTWKQIGTDLPTEPINVVKEDPKNEQILYVGTDNGLYVSLNQGQSFMAMKGGLPRVPVHDIMIQQRENEIVVGTHGRSIYIAKLDLVQKLTPELMQKNLALFEVKVPHYSANWGKTFGGSSREGLEAKMEIPYFVKAAGSVLLQIKSEKGLVLKTLRDTVDAGFNFMPYHFTIDEAAVKGFEKTLTGKYKNIPQAENKKYYLVPGTYTIELTTAKGDRLTQSFTLSEMSKKQQEEANAAINGESEQELLK